MTRGVIARASCWPKRASASTSSASRPGRFPEDLLDLNPYHSVPTLVDRDLVLYDSRVIIEYLDERFPHPPLMPVDPVTRAQFRLALYRIERDWYSAGASRSSTEPDKKQTVKLKKILRDTILQSTDLFKVKPYFLSDEFSLVDATIAPMLWRLPHYEIDLPPQAQPIEKYAQPGVRAARRSAKACPSASRRCASCSAWPETGTAQAPVPAARHAPVDHRLRAHAARDRRRRTRRCRSAARLRQGRQDRART